ncbi:hypothetical protein P9112_001992 [Eukaryota sp. TZLM1-RC]
MQPGCFRSRSLFITIRKRCVREQVSRFTTTHNCVVKVGLSEFSLFVTNVPRRFEICAYNKPFVAKVRFYLNIPIDELLLKETCVSSNSSQFTLRHAFNCPKLTTYRSSIHEAVKDTVFNMARNARLPCIKEPLLREILSFNSEAVVDFVSCKVASDTLVLKKNLNPVNALENKANEKHRKYDKDIKEAHADRNKPFIFIVLLFSKTEDYQ